MRKMMWNRYTRVLKNKNKVILGNRYNGQWIKISNECYEILDLVVSKKFTDDRVINSLEDEDDKKYFKKKFLSIKKDTLKIECLLSNTITCSKFKLTI